MKTLAPLFAGLLLCSCATQTGGISPNSSAEEVHAYLLRRSSQDGYVAENRELRKLGYPPSAGEAREDYIVRLNAIRAKLDSKHRERMASMPRFSPPPANYDLIRIAADNRARRDGDMAQHNAMTNQLIQNAVTPPQRPAYNPIQYIRPIGGGMRGVGSSFDYNEWDQRQKIDGIARKLGVR